MLSSIVLHISWPPAVSKTNSHLQNHRVHQQIVHGPASGAADSNSAHPKKKLARQGRMDFFFHLLGGFLRNYFGMMTRKTIYRRKKMDKKNARITCTASYNTEDASLAQRTFGAGLRRRSIRCCAVLEDVTNAFACTLAEVRKQVLEQCYQGTGFQMVEERCTERSDPAQDGRIPASVLVCHEEATSGVQWRLLAYSAAGSSREWNNGCRRRGISRGRRA